MLDVRNYLEEEVACFPQWQEDTNHASGEDDEESKYYVEAEIS